MGKQERIDSEIKTLEYLEDELNKLLCQIKPSDKLSKGDIFTVEKDITLPGVKGKIIKKGSFITIKNIIKRGKGKTNTIEYSINSDYDNINEMSKMIFVINFCKDLVLQEENLSKKVKKLKNKIKAEEDKIGKKKVLDESDKVQEKVHFLLKIVRKFLKKV